MNFDIASWQKAQVPAVIVAVPSDMINIFGDAALTILPGSPSLYLMLLANDTAGLTGVRLELVQSTNVIVKFNGLELPAPVYDFGAATAANETLTFEVPAGVFDGSEDVVVRFVGSADGGATEVYAERTVSVSY